MSALPPKADIRMHKNCCPRDRHHDRLPRVEGRYARVPPSAFAHGLGGGRLHAHGCVPFQHRHAHARRGRGLSGLVSPWPTSPRQNLALRCGRKWRNTAVFAHNSHYVESTSAVLCGSALDALATIKMWWVSPPFLACCTATLEALEAGRDEPRGDIHESPDQRFPCGRWGGRQARRRSRHTKRRRSPASMFRPARRRRERRDAHTRPSR